MKPDQLIDVRKSVSENDRQFHAKGKLNGDGKTEDKSFTTAIKQMHEGISSVRYVDQCSLGITLYRAYIDDWPQIEKLVFSMICARLGWIYKKVTIRYHDVNGKSEKGSSKRYRLTSKQTNEKKLEKLLVSASVAGDNVEPDEP